MTGILIVDDEPDMRLLVQTVIESDGSGLRIVGQAASGTEAIRCWRDTRPEVILLDNRMPDMSGLEAAEQILAERPDQSIVLFSAYLDDATVRKAAELGIRACLPKSDLSRIPEAMWKHGPGAA